MFSFVKTELNWSLKISALSLLSDSGWWSLVRVGTYSNSVYFRLLM